MLAHCEIALEGADDSETRALLISDVSSSDSLRKNLQGSPLRVGFSPAGPEGIAAAIQARPQVLLIDGRTEERRALRLCSRLRSEHEVSSAFLIVITSEDHEDLRVEAFDAGADDCFAEPPTRRELWSRLQALKRRMERRAPVEVLRYADLELDLVRHKASRGGRPLYLSTLQMRLLRHFIEKPGAVFSRQQLMEAVWGDKSPDEGAVTVAVVRLRRALNSTGQPDLIRQVRGVGYALEADEPRSGDQ